MHKGTADALIILLVHHLAKSATSSSMVDWATDALVSGEDSPSLVILAGLDRTSSVFEASPWLDKALDELRVPSLTPADLRRAFVGVVSRALLEDRITAEQALDSVHQHAVSPLNHPPDLAHWCYVWERLNPLDFTELSGVDRDTEARRLAGDWAGHPGFAARGA